MPNYNYLLGPNFQAEDVSGKPLVGGYVEVYLHNTTTKYVTKKDFNGTDNEFRVVLNSLGMAVIIADVANAYDVYCYDRLGSLIWSRLNVNCNLITNDYLDYLGIVTYDISQPNLYSDTIQCLLDGQIPVITAGAAGNVRYYYYTSRNDTAHTITFTCGYGEKVELLTIKNDNSYEFVEVSGKAVIYNWADIVNGGGYSVIAADVTSGKQIFVVFEPAPGMKAYAQPVQIVPQYQIAMFSLLAMLPEGDIHELQSYNFVVQGSSTNVIPGYVIPEVMVIPYTDGSEINPSAIVDMTAAGGSDGKRLVVLDKIITDTTDPDNPVTKHTILYPSFNLNGNRFPADPTVVQVQDWTFRSIPDSDGTYYETVVNDGGFVSETELHTCNFKIFTPTATFNDINDCVSSGITPFLKVSGQLYSYVGYNATTYGHMFCSTEVVRPQYPGWNMTPPFIVSRTEMYSIKSGYSWVPTVANLTPASIPIASGTPSQGTIDYLVNAFHAAHNEGFEIGVVTWTNSDISLGWTGVRKYIPVYCSKTGNISTSTEHVDFVLMCADATGVHLITLSQDTTNTFTTSDISYGGGSPFDYTIFAPAFDSTAAYLIPGKLVTYNDALYRLRKQKNPGPWDASTAVQDDVNHNLGRISDAGEAGLVNGYYVIKNNATQSVAHGTNTDLLIELDIDLGEVPNFVVEVDSAYAVNCYIKIWYDDGTGMLPMKWAKYSNDAGETIPAGRCQITCVGESWTWAQFTQSSGPTP